MTKLLPCPFCGSEAEVSDRYGLGHFVRCTNENCPDGGVYISEGAAIEAWNTRADATLLDRLHTAEAERDKLREALSRAVVMLREACTILGWEYTDDYAMTIETFLSTLEDAS